MIEPLSNIPNGVDCEVKEVIASDLRVKLLEMGLVEGKKLRVLYRAPLGDPIAVDLDGYVLALRTEEAGLIHVESTHSS